MKRLLLLSTLGVVVFLLFFGLPGRAQEEAAGFQVIVHAENPTTTIEDRTLSKMFLKKVKRWDDDVSVVVYDLEEDSPVREAFTREVHGKSVSAIESYWQRMIFSGRDVPPDEVASDAEVIAEVAAQRGAVAYVSADAQLPASVKTLTIEK